MSSATDESTAKFAVLVRTRAHAGRGDELVQAYAPVFEQVSEEDTTELYMLHRAVDDPDLFFCFEIFSSRADFDAHRAGAKASDKLDPLDAVTAEREFVWGVPVWTKA
jgi:quinol monooxygenase YgiN